MADAVTPSTCTKTTRGSKRKYEDAMQENISSLLITGAHSDLTIICDGQSWQVHKVIVCGFSPVIRRAIESSQWQEGQDSIIPHEAYGRDEMSSMIDFMYKGKYIVEESVQDKILRSLEDRRDQAVEGKISGFTGRTANVNDEMQARRDQDEAISSTQERNTDARANSPPAGSTRSADDDKPYRGLYGYKEERVKLKSLDQCLLTEAVVAELAHHIKVYALADYYGVSELQELATNKYSGLLRGCKDSLPSDLWCCLLGVVDDLLQPSTTIRRITVEFTAKHLVHVQSTEPWSEALSRGALPSSISSQILRAMSSCIRSNVESIPPILRAVTWGIREEFSDDAVICAKYSLHEHLLELRKRVKWELSDHQDLQERLIILASNSDPVCQYCGKENPRLPAGTNVPIWFICDEDRIHCRHCESLCTGFECDQDAIRARLTRR